MPSPLEWYVFGTALAFLSLFAAAGYYDASASGYARQRWHAPVEWTAAAAFVALAVAALIGVYGTVPPRLADRRGVLVLALHVAPLVAGSVALAVAVSHGRTLVRFRRAGDVPTGTVADRAAGERVAVGGVVACDEPGTSPALSRPAACWSWRFYVRGMFGQDDDPDWIAQKGGSGGVPFSLDDGSGPVAVDPAGAHVDLRGGREYVCDADADQPGRVGDELRSSLAGDEYRYEEAVATAGQRLLVLGTVTSDGVIDADRIVDPGVDGAERRYAIRTAAFGACGALGVIVGVWLTASFFDAPLLFTGLSHMSIARLSPT